MIFHVLVVVPILLVKQKEHYMKGQLKMLGLTITILLTNISTTAHLHLFGIASLHSSLFTSSAPTQNNEKFDLRTVRINLVQDNTEIIDRHKNWNILLFKEALNIKELNPILNSGLKASKELQLY